MWREVSETEETAVQIDLRGANRHEASASWLATGLTLASLLAIGVVVNAVRSTPVLATSPSVQWTNYHPDTQAEIDQAYIERDCGALQGWLIAAAESDSSVRATNGSGSLDLIRYVDYALDLADC